jgi:hypothetical protein
MTAVLLAWLGVSSVPLALPELLWPAGRPFLAAAASVSLLLATYSLGRGSRILGLLLAIVAATAWFGWWRVAAEKEALSHLCGLALGLLAMAAVVSWSTTRARLAIAVAVFLLAALPVLVLGLAGTSVAPSKLTPVRVTDRLPEKKLGLPGLESNGFVNPSALGAAALMIAPVAIAVACRRRSAYVRGALRLLGIVVAVGAITQARAVWVSTVVIAVVAALWLPRSVRVRAVLVGSVLIPAGLVAVITGVPQRLVHEGTSSITYREGIWQQGLQRLGASPWTGIGLNHFRYVYVPPDVVRDRPDISGAPHAHNIFIQTALDLGLGLTAYVTLLALMLFAAVRVHRDYDADALPRDVVAGATLSIVGVHVFGLADAVALGAKIGLFQWYAAGLVLAGAALTARPSSGRGSVAGGIAARLWRSRSDPFRPLSSGTIRVFSPLRDAFALAWHAVRGVI